MTLPFFKSSQRPYRFPSRLTFKFLPMFVVFLVCSCLLLPAQQVYQPKADAKATVQSGNVRFTVLTPQLIRMEWSADGKFEDRPSFVVLNRLLPVPSFAQSNAGKD